MSQASEEQVVKLKEGRGAFKILTGKRHLGRPRRRWEDNIKIDIKEIRGVGLIRLRI